MENMGEVLIVRAIMGSTGIPPTTYEVRERGRERERDREREGERGGEGREGGRERHTCNYVPQSMYMYDSLYFVILHL